MKFFALATLIPLVTLITYLLLPPQIPLSPTSLISPLQNRDTAKRDYVVLGFAPYWNLKKLAPESFDPLTHFAYFAVHLTSSGDVYTHANRREQDPGYTNYQRLLRDELAVPNKPLILTFMPADQDALTAILTSQTARQNTVSTITQAVTDSGAGGVNIDFEPLGDIDSSLRDSFTQFIRDLRSELSTLQTFKLLTISIYPSAAARPRIWNLAALAPLADYLVVMTYDYTMPITDNAGPNSPLRDTGGTFEHNIVKNISEISSLVDSRKLLLGIPFYGYEWDTVDETKYAPTIGRGVTASLERIQQMLDSQTLSLLWDRNSLTAYGVATTAGQSSQIYFDNETSLRLKLDFVRDANLGGIAIWALGYDNNVPWLWPTIATLNQK